MTTKSLAAEEYLCQKELEILQLRAIVSGLYQAGKSRQNDVFYRYETLLNQNALTISSLQLPCAECGTDKPFSAYFSTTFSGNPAPFCV